jgi:acetyl esterase/lipase
LFLNLEKKKMKVDEISYTSSLCADVYHGSDQQRPVVIVVHGGIWLMGSKQNVRNMCLELYQKTNYICVAPNYSLSTIMDLFLVRALCIELTTLALILLIIKDRPLVSVLTIILVFAILFCLVKLIYVDNKNQHPQHVLDIAECVRWTYENISKYGGDPNQIILLGHSAGAHLVSLLAINEKYIASVALDRSVIKGVISISGPYSHSRILTNPFIVQIIQHIGFKSRQNELFDAWPLTSIDPRVSNPPFLLVVAEFDHTIELHTLDFYHALRDAGTYVRVKKADNATHFTVKEYWNSKNKGVLQSIVNFMECLT